MGHASEYSDKLVFAEKAVGGIHGSSAGDRKPHGQRLCTYKQDLTAPLPVPCLMEVIMADLNSLFSEAAARHAERPAVRMDELVLSYSQLRDAAYRMASLLSSAGITPGDRVALMLPNVPAFPVAFYGALATGAIVVPMNPLLKSREIAYQLSDSRASVLLAWHAAAGEAALGAAASGVQILKVDEPGAAGLLAGLAPVPAGVERAAGDDAVILYTSGTTGVPKGAELTHAGLTRNACVTARNLLNAGPDDVVMGCLPLFHVFGLTCALNAAIAVGASLTLLPRFDPAKALQIVGRDRVTIFEGVPTMYMAMLHDPAGARADTSSLRVCVSGGAAMPAEIMRGFERAFGCMILEGYGLSETSPVASFNHPDRVRKPGSIGTPIQGVEMRVVNDEGTELPVGQIGEIVIRGYNVMKGYWRNPSATAETITGGWLKTGDLARVDGDGYFYIVDRKKDLIIRGGLNVYPLEIEEVLYEHPAVAEAAVIGIPDEHLGEEIGAAVTLKPAATATTGELRAFVKDRVAPYKYPRYVWIRPDLPKGPTGKILRREVSPPQDLRQG
jgi:long-chain acyl-CoA synthetase